MFSPVGIQCDLDRDIHNGYTPKTVIKQFEHNEEVAGHMITIGQDIFDKYRDIVYNGEVVSV